MAPDRTVETKHRRREHLLFHIALVEQRWKGGPCVALSVAPAAPAPAGRGIAIVPSPRGHPWIRFAVVEAVASKARGRIVQHGREGIADAVCEFEFESARGGIAQHVAELVPGPARVGSEAQGLSGQAAMIVRVHRAVAQLRPTRKPPRAAAGLLASYLALATVPAGPRRRTCAITDFAVGMRTKGSAVPHQQRQLREFEIGVVPERSKSRQPSEKLPRPQECLRGRQMVAAQGKIGGSMDCTARARFSDPR